MIKVFCTIFLLCLPYLGYAGSSVQYPTEIPASTLEQQVLQQQLLSLPAEQRNQLQWRQLAIVSIALLSSADAPEVKEAEGILQQARAVYPQDVEIMAVQGSLFCIQAGSAGMDGIQAMAMSNKGFRQLDRAVSLAPDHLGARLQRAITASQTPAFLGKRQRASDDFTYLLSMVPAKSDKKPFRAMLLYQFAEMLQKNDKAMALDLRKQAVELNAGIWSERAKERLEP